MTDENSTTAVVHDSTASATAPPNVEPTGAETETDLGLSRFPTTSFRMMPKDINPDGNIYGGVIMDHIDTSACRAAYWVHSGKVVTLKAETTFLAPVLIADFLTTWAEVVKIGRTSITIKVTVKANRNVPCAEGGIEEVEVIAAESTVVYVAVNDKGKPTAVDRLGTDKRFRVKPAA
jgi:acyl-CoA thioesterase YciA